MIKELEKIFDAMEEELENMLKELDIKDELMTKYAYDTLSTARLGDKQTERHKIRIHTAKGRV